MGMLDKSMLLTKQALKVEKVEFENGDFVYVREMTGKDRDNFENSILKARRDAKGDIKGYDQVMDNFRSKLAVVTLCDEEGSLLFEPTDADKLSSNISITYLEKIVEKASSLNAITPKDKEELIKNSEADPDGNSSLDSAGNLE
jgi:hypothetical protein